MSNSSKGEGVSSSSSDHFSNKKSSYYLSKFHRRVYRQIVQYQTLRDHLSGTLDEQGLGIARSLGIPEAAIRSTEIRDHAEKSCLVGLKVEFELYLYIVCHLVLDGTLDHVHTTGHLGERQQKLGDLIGNKRAFYDAFIEKGLRDPTRLFIDMAVPDYGLRRMLDLMKKCGLDDAIAFTAEQSRDFSGQLSNSAGIEIEPWAQVQTAFQVRHAIEHAFSRVSPDFLRKAKMHWPASSWRRHFDSALGPRKGERLILDNTDIQTTASAMVAIAERLAAVTENLSLYLD